MSFNRKSRIALKNYVLNKRSDLVKAELEKAEVEDTPFKLAKLVIQKEQLGELTTAEALEDLAQLSLHDELNVNTPLEYCFKSK